ncbi:hypothetical protein [Lentzea sp. NPDC059081]|uniref:hypothetical protein n=1 Tax=Lentzea sp. NPDC059081 TaxID=3346719 RepID=UPI00368B12C0
MTHQRLIALPPLPPEGWVSWLHTEDIDEELAEYGRSCAALTRLRDGHEDLAPASLEAEADVVLVALTGTLSTLYLAAVQKLDQLRVVANELMPSLLAFRDLATRACENLLDALEESTEDARAVLRVDRELVPVASWLCGHLKLFEAGFDFQHRAADAVADLVADADAWNAGEDVADRVRRGCRELRRCLHFDLDVFAQTVRRWMEDYAAVVDEIRSRYAVVSMVVEGAVELSTLRNALDAPG